MNGGNVTDDKTVTSETLPLGLDALLDVVIGLPMSMSSREAQRDTGVQLRDIAFARFNAIGARNPTSAAYIDEIVPTIWSASRGMAVGRDLFASKVKYLNEQEADTVGYLDALAGLAPLNKDGWLFRLLPLLPLAVTAAAGIKKWGLKGWLSLIAVSVLAVFVVDIVLKVIRWVFASRARKRTQDEMGRYWSQALNQYRAVLRDFLRSAVRTAERYYPDSAMRQFELATGMKPKNLLMTEEDDIKALDALIDQHISLRPLDT
jgi:hypothetical protein